MYCIGVSGWKMKSQTKTYRITKNNWKLWEIERYEVKGWQNQFHLWEIRVFRLNGLEENIRVNSVFALCCPTVFSSIFDFVSIANMNFCHYTNLIICRFVLLSMCKYSLCGRTIRLNYIELIKAKLPKTRLKKNHHAVRTDGSLELLRGNS